MGTASWERLEGGHDVEQDAAESEVSDVAAESPANDAIRSWLTKGIHTFRIDSRRLGGRGHARQVLGEDRGTAGPVAGGWRDLASALQRHALHNALTRLSAEERRVVTLAYLEGRTNRQIATLLGVSVSTVRRRLWFALEHLDDYVRRTGTWVSSIALVGLLYVADRSARLGRLLSSSAAELPHKLAATVALGTVAVAGFGLVALDQHASTSKHTPAPATARLNPGVPGATRSILAKVSPLGPTITVSTDPTDAAPVVVRTVAAVTTHAAPVKSDSKGSTVTVAAARKGDSDNGEKKTEKKGGTSEESNKGDQKSLTTRSPETTGDHKL